MSILKTFFGQAQVVPAFDPVDLNGQANTGGWVNLSRFKMAVIELVTGARTSGDTVTVTVLQAKDSSGTGSKAINFTTFFTKVGATLPGTFTKQTQAAANTASDSTTGDVKLVMGIEILPEYLDSDGGFNHISITVNQPGHACYGSAVYHLLSPIYGAEPEVTSID